jgi:hypothetical protein
VAFGAVEGVGNEVGQSGLGKSGGGEAFRPGEEVSNEERYASLLTSSPGRNRSASGKV